MFELQVCNASKFLRFYAALGLVLTVASVDKALALPINLCYEYSVNQQLKYVSIPMDSVFINVDLNKNPNRHCRLMLIDASSKSKDTMVLLQDYESMKFLDSISFNFLENDTLMVVNYKSIVSDNLGEHGNFREETEVFQVWNVVSKHLIFDATPYFLYRSDYMSWPTDSTVEITETACEYAYLIDLTDSLITIGPKRIFANENCDMFPEEHLSGVYKRIGNRYFRKE